MTLVDIFRLFRFVRELAGNHGQRVNAIQKWSGGADGDSWCCELATMVLDLFFQGESPVPRTGVCQEVYELAQKNGWLVDEPEPGDLFVYVNDAGHAHHIGLVTTNAPLAGIAGNTSEDGTSSNGTGCYEHEISRGPHTKFIRVPGAHACRA